MATPMPESVKWIEVHDFITEAAVIQGRPFEMKMGRNEVMVLLSLYCWWKGTPAAGDCAVNVGLWRKTDSNPASVYGLGDSPDMVWSKQTLSTYVAESMKSCDSDHIIFPWPIILVRPPRAVWRTSVLTNVMLSMRLYYLLREIKDVDLAKLMVKDHA